MYAQAQPLHYAPPHEQRVELPGGPFSLSASLSLSVRRWDPRSLLGGGECGGTRTRTRYRPRCGHYYAVTPATRCRFVFSFFLRVLYFSNKRLLPEITRLTKSIVIFYPLFCLFLNSGYYALMPFDMCVFNTHHAHCIRLELSIYWLFQNRRRIRNP